MGSFKNFKGLPTLGSPFFISTLTHKTNIINTQSVAYLYKTLIKFRMKSLNFLLVTFGLIISFYSTAQIGCTSIDACNYDPFAVVDDGSCVNFIDCAGICGGTFVQDLCGNCYDPNAAGNDQNVAFNFAGQITNWTVPAGVSTITIEAFGAAGGGSGTPGRGARMQGDFSVNPGDVLRILVGGQGASIGGSSSGGGGGGTFVVKLDPAGEYTMFDGQNVTPLLVAGGGSGACNGQVFEGGRTTTNGGGLNPGSNCSGAGTGNFGGGGGAGFCTAGTNGFYGQGGNSFLSGGAAVPQGGFGGGGGHSNGGGNIAGGGGGWSGGSGNTEAQYNSGGGGSFNQGANQQAEANIRSGNGLVNISFGSVPECNAGCTDPLACNFDPNAQIEAGNCVYPDGCTDQSACNFDPAANCDNGSCSYPGCNNLEACNYDALAGCDNGNCIFILDCAGICGGTFVQDLCGNCYDLSIAGNDETITFNFAGQITNWTVPAGVSTITIEAFGAAGGGSGTPGRGARMQGDFSVNPGDVLRILVGGQGGSIGGSSSGGGGGGTFIAKLDPAGAYTMFDGQTVTPLIVAGGGSGACNGQVFEGGRTTLNGGGLNPGTNCSGAGTGNFGGGGGAGFCTAGTNGFYGQGGNSFLSGGAAVPQGGFGGGGGHSNNGGNIAGGGGGWSGGSGNTEAEYNSGGGGSYNQGANQLAEANIRSGNGLVNISFGSVPECNAGCTDPLACNFDPNAQIEAGNCVYPDGCTDQSACNFDPAANCDNGSCSYPGCNNPEACNYDALAGCDNGNCIFILDCAGICGGTFVQDLCGNCYDPSIAGNDETITFNFAGQITNWTVPAGVSTITIEAFGAAGGGSGTPGRGARMQGDFSVNPGDVLRILVGGQGGSIGGSSSGGGGGGTFIAKLDPAGAYTMFDGQTVTPLIVAGGGSGACNGQVFEGGRTTLNGGGLNPGTNCSGAGTGNFGGGGGGGFCTNGTNGFYGQGGTSFLNGGAAIPQGGFGGGGGHSNGGANIAGGGGGWSGGSGNTEAEYNSGGGGSYNQGANQLAEANIRSGNGLVNISFGSVPECNAGCTNPNADNFNPQANFDDGSCIVSGCTDQTAANYNEQANTDDGSCIFLGCTDPNANNYNSQANSDDGSCIYLGCTNPQADNYNPQANSDDGSCVLFGCTHPLAANYNPQANADDGSCQFFGCTYPSASNYDSNANIDNGTCVFNDFPILLGCTDPAACNFSILANLDDGSCEYVSCAACTNINACNFNPLATIDNGSCLYADVCGNCGGTSIAGCTNASACNFDVNAGCDDGSCEFNTCAGCTNAAACNYDANATLDNGTCEIAGCTDNGACNYNVNAVCDDASCEYISCAGCTDSLACNFNAFANSDDGSCDFSCIGCTYIGANNYNANATIDDGSCTFGPSEIACGIGTFWDPITETCQAFLDCPADLNNDGVVSAGDLLIFLSAFGTFCN
jgi:hypothetical protein